MLFFRPMLRRNFTTQEKLYYPQIAPCPTVDFDDVCNEITAKCTLTRADVEAVLIDLEEHITAHLKEGYTVRLGRLGSFRVTARVRTCSSAEAAAKEGASLIKRLPVRFTPGAYLRQMLAVDRLTFVNVRKK